MAAPRASAQPPPGPSNGQHRDRVAEALYNWCLENYDVGHIFDQNALLSSPVIPNRDLNVLLTSSNHLVAKNLFKLHDIKATNVLGWELVSQERAANYTGLSRDEHLVFACIDSAGTAGMWTKHVMKRLNAHTKVLERTIKTLESKGIIKPMKSVKYPQRKMYIVAGLQPSEEATGGAWYTDGKLDEPLIVIMAGKIEEFVSNRSWVEIVDQSQVLIDSSNNKRKAPHDGFDVKGKGKSKVTRIDDDQPRSESPELKHKSKHHRSHARRSYAPQAPGYEGYPTLADITRFINNSKIANSVFPQNAIAQLLDLMVYDDRLFKVTRPPHDQEFPEDGFSDKITMYRCFKSPTAREKDRDLNHRYYSKDSVTQNAAKRQFELEEIGRGGTTEVPCLKCPAFELCGDGGPVNVVTCPYFDEWYIKAAKADMTLDPWPGGEQFIKDGETKKDRRVKNLPAVVVKVDADDEKVDLTMGKE